MAIKSTLKTLADARGVTIRELSRAIGYRFESVRSLYNDETERIPRELLDRICEYFDCDISDILKRTP